MLFPPPPEPTDNVPQWNRASLLSLAAVIAVGLGLSWACRFATLTVYGDDPIYLTLSQSLASGHYRDEFLIGSPPHAQYPPGMAIYLLLLRSIGGDSLDFLIAANLLVLGVTIALAADALRRLTTRWIGVAAAALMVFNPQITQLARELRSEIPFLFFASLSLWLLLLDGPRRRRWFPALAVAAAVAAFLMRSAGIALLPAVSWAFLLRKQWRALLAGGALVLAAGYGWFAYTHWAAANTIGHSYAVDLVNLPGKSITRLVLDGFTRGRAYFSGFAGVQFAVPDIPNQPIDNGIVGLLLAIPMAVGAWSLRRRWAPMALFLTISVAILLVFPYVVARLLSVLIPWLVIVLLLGWRKLLTGLGQPRTDRITIAIAILLTSFGLLHQVAEAQLRTGCRAGVPYREPSCSTPEDRGYVAAAEFVRDSLAPAAVIAASKSASLYQISHHKAFPLELLRNSDLSDILAPGGPVNAVLLSRQYRYEGGAVATRLHARCSGLKLLFKHPTGALLLAVADSTGVPHPESCAAIEEFIRNTVAEAED